MALCKNFHGAVGELCVSKVKILMSANMAKHFNVSEKVGKASKLRPYGKSPN